MQRPRRRCWRDRFRGPSPSARPIRPPGLQPYPEVEAVASEGARRGIFLGQCMSDDGGRPRLARNRDQFRCSARGQTATLLRQKGEIGDLNAAFIVRGALEARQSHQTAALAQTVVAPWRCLRLRENFRKDRRPLSRERRIAELGLAIGRRQFQTHAAFCRCRRPSSSAICTAFSAAPLRRLSDTHQSDRPFSTVGSSRTRLTKVAYSPTASTGVT